MPRPLTPWARSTSWKAFASHHGPDFYGLPRNTGTVTLCREPYALPEAVPFGDAQLKPLRGGETLAWRLR
jgi:dihydroorotase